MPFLLTEYDNYKLIIMIQYLPTNFVDMRFSGARAYLKYTGHCLPTVGHTLCDVLQRQLVVVQVYGAGLTPHRHVVVRRVVGLRRTASEQFGGPVVEHRTVVQTVAAQVARFFHCWTQTIPIVLLLDRRTHDTSRGGGETWEGITEK